VRFDQAPVDAVAKQRLDVLVGSPRFGSREHQILDVADARHELDAKQVRQPEHWKARADVFEYIELFYNPKRRHSTIGQVSPVEFERQYFLKNQSV